jgi:hypothetical protein
MSRKEGWKIRVQSEIFGLDNKILALNSFMNGMEYQSLDLVQQTLLETQLHIMKSYSEILTSRVRVADGL